MIKINAGSMIAFLLGLAMPDIKSDNAATTSLWKFIISFPAIIALLQSCLMLIVFYHETPKYYIMRNKPELAKKALKRIYTENTEVDTILNKLVKEITIASDVILL